MNDTGFYINGLAFKPSDWGSSGRPIIRIQNLTNPSTPFNYATGDFPDEVVVRDGDILVSWSATLATFQWRGDDAILNQHIFRVIPAEGATEKAYLRLILEKAIKDLAAGEHAHGLVMAHINRGPFLDHIVLIPPLAEQQRIVAKVDELMALCDALEAESAASMAAHQALVDALLANLTTSTDAADLATNWARLEANFDALFTTEASVDALKQAVLQLAVYGVLVAPVATDRSSSEAVKAAARAKKGLAEREGLRARSTIQRNNLACPDETFPLHWMITDFDTILITVSGVTKGQKIPAIEAIEAPYLRVANVQRGFVDLGEIKSITVKRSDFERYQLRNGDVLMTEGGDWDKLGRAAIWREEIPNCIHQNHVFRVRFEQSVLLPEWVVIFVNSPVGREYFSRAAKQTTNLASINMTQLRSCPLPFPPTNEQQRIVAKVDELLTLCDALTASFAGACSTQRSLANTIIECAAP